jgi:hypothetical protein
MRRVIHAIVVVVVIIIIIITIIMEISDAVHVLG